MEKGKNLICIVLALELISCATSGGREGFDIRVSESIFLDCASVIIALPLALPVIGLEALGIPIVHSKRQLYQNKISAAEDPKTSAEVLEELANHSYEEIRKSVAQNPKAPLKLLEKLARDEDPSVRAAVTKNPKITLETLEKLARDENPSVRAAVAENFKTTLETLERLARDEDPSVRAAVAENSKTTLETLERLARDPNSQVSSSARKALIKIQFNKTS